MKKPKISFRYFKQLSYAAVPAFFSILFFQNCQPGFQAIDAQALSEGSSNSLDFANSIQSGDSQLCHRWVNGNDQNGIPTWGPSLGNCNSSSMPLLFSVTHENECNTHMACKGYPNDRNYKDNILAYMADYDSKDIGHWIKYSAVGDSSTNQIELALDTINYAHEISPTGRPVSNGYIFFGMANLEFNSKINLNEELWVEFEYNVSGSELGNPTKAGNRLMLAAALNWDEPGRANKAHYFEINLYKTQDYHKAHYDINQCTKDASYDHCYYDSNGKWAEGKYISADMAFGYPGPISPDNQWRKVRVDLFKLAKKYQWFHPPADWSRAKTDGIYIGLESKDLSRIYAKIRNLKIWKGATDPQIPTPTPTPVPTPSPIDGNWSIWTDQGACSKTCGGGVITQVRTCTDPAPANGGKACIGSSSQQISCNTQVCPIEPDPAPSTSGSSSLQMNATSHPIGFFRDGFGGFKSDGVSYCVFNDGAQMIASGYSQSDYDNARQFSQRNIRLPFIGTCTDNTKMGLIRQDAAGLIRHKNGLCLLSSGEHLTKCGYRQQDYTSAAQESIGTLDKYPMCNCD